MPLVIIMVMIGSYYIYDKECCNRCVITCIPVVLVLALGEGIMTGAAREVILVSPDPFALNAVGFFVFEQSKYRFMSRDKHSQEGIGISNHASMAASG